MKYKRLMIKIFIQSVNTFIQYTRPQKNYREPVPIYFDQTSYSHDAIKKN